MDTCFKFPTDDIFKKEFSIPKFSKFHIKLDNFKENLNSSFLNFLHKNNIDIAICELFSYVPYYTLPIHIDGPGNSENLCKINYIIGGKNSTVSWYTVKPNAIPRISKTPIGTDYIKYMDEDLEFYESKELLGAWVVKVGIPHMVKNSAELRYCISMPLVYKDTQMSVPFDEVKNLLQPS